MTIELPTAYFTSAISRGDKRYLMAQSVKSSKEFLRYERMWFVVAARRRSINKYGRLLAYESN